MRKGNYIMPKYSSFKNQQLLTENFRRFLSEDEYGDKDPDDFYDIDPITGDQREIGVRVGNPEGFDVISDWSAEAMEKRAHEDALAGEGMNPFYKLGAVYPDNGNRKFKQRAAKMYRIAFKKALARAEKDEPIS
jgi:hypothetical protein